MKIVAHRGNRLHAPENTRESLISAYTAGADALQLDVQLGDDGRLLVSRDASPHAAAEELHRLLDTLPADVPKLIELRHESIREEDRRAELVDSLMDPIRERALEDEVIVYSKDAEALRLARERAPYLAICTYDWERDAGEQVDLMEEYHADGLVIELDSIFGRGQLNEVGERLARLHSERDFRVGAVIYLNREEPVFSETEFRMLRKYALVYGAATDSMLRVAPFTRSTRPYVDEPLESRDAELLEFDSRGGLGLAEGIEGDFAAEVDYEGAAVEMAVLNTDVGGDGDVFFEPGAAPPFTRIERAGEDGHRLSWNLGYEQSSTRYGDPAGGGEAAGGRLRLERRGPWFSAYFRAGEEGSDWVCAGAVRNDSLNRRVFLRCVGDGELGLRNLLVTRHPSV